MGSLPLSVCIPTLNEEQNLGACVAALQGAVDEVVVVDSGSTDRTVELAKDLGLKVLSFRWDGNFPKKRNWTLRNYNFQHDWILFLDADEWVTTDFLGEVESVLPSTSHVGFWIRYHNWFQGKRLRHGDTFRKLSLFKIGAGEYERFPEQWWSHLDMEVHEHPVLDGTVGSMRSILEHHDDRGLDHYHRKHEAYAEWEANRWKYLQDGESDQWEQLTLRQQFKYKNLDQWWLPSLYFLASYGFKGGFLDGEAGLTFARLKWGYFKRIQEKISSRA